MSSIFIKTWKHVPVNILIPLRNPKDHAYDYYNIMLLDICNKVLLYGIMSKSCVFQMRPNLAMRF